MAIPQIQALRTWVDGQSFSARDYIYERNLAVFKINEVVTRVNSLAPDLANDTALLDSRYYQQYILDADFIADRNRLTALESLTDQAVLQTSNVLFNSVTADTLTSPVTNSTTVNTTTVNVSGDVIVPTHGSVVNTFQDLKDDKIDKIVSQYPKTTLGLGNGASQRIYIQDNLAASHLTIDELRTYIATNFASFGFVLATADANGLPDIPESERFDNKIYLIPNVAPDGLADSYAEYLYIADNWEFIGTTEVNLENYYTQTDLDTLLGIQGDTEQSFHVAITGDDNNPGTEWRPFRTIKHACAAAAALPPSGFTMITINSINIPVPIPQLISIKISSGRYYEQLPIVVPPYVSLVGTDLRSTLVYPAEGLSDDGETPNNESTMFQMSVGTLAMNLSLYDMTGWVAPADLLDPESTVPKGIGFALNPASPILGPSPYILECSSFFTAGIGAYIDGSIHITAQGNPVGNRSMLFATYTNLVDGGVGFWADKGGLAEMVTNFTYFSIYGYLATRGGYLRSLNGSNSWGTWALFATGNLESETPLTATLAGNILEYSDLVTDFVVDETITGATSGATATILNVQTTASTLYIEKIVPDAPQTFAVTVQNVGGSNVYFVNGEQNPILNLAPGAVYTFDQSEATNDNHPLAFRDLSDTTYTDGVVSTGTPGQAGAQTVFTVPSNAPLTLRYYCTVHGNSMGNTINIIDPQAEFINGEVITSATGSAAALGTERGQNGGLLLVRGLAENPEIRQSISIADDTFTYVVASVSGTYVDANSIIILTLSTSKAVGSLAGTAVELRKRYSQIRVTGHDFLNVGAGTLAQVRLNGGTLINPGTPPAVGQQVGEFDTGRVFSVSTDQDGNFKVGKFFGIDQGTGRATLDASAFDLSGLTSLRLGSIGAQLGESINEFSSDPNLTQNSNEKVPTQAAVKLFVENTITNTLTGQTSLTNVTLSNLTVTNDLDVEGTIFVDGEKATDEFTATVTTGWTGTEPAVRTITVTGLLATDNPIIDLDLDGLAYSSWEDIEKAWVLVKKADIAANEITFSASEAPEVNIPIKIKVVR